MHKNKKKTPAQILRRLENPDSLVRCSAADHPNATPGVLMNGLVDEDDEVCENAQRRIDSDPLLGLLIAALKGDAGS